MGENHDLKKCIAITMHDCTISCDYTWLGNSGSIPCILSNECFKLAGKVILLKVLPEHFDQPLPHLQWGAYSNGSQLLSARVSVEDGVFILTKGKELYLVTPTGTKLLSGNLDNIIDHYLWVDEVSPT